MDMRGRGTLGSLRARAQHGAATRHGERHSLDGARETLVTLGVIVLEADLELDGLEEVALLGLESCLCRLQSVR